MSSADDRASDGEDPLRVLAVDDDPVFLKGVERMLRRAPCTVTLYASPERALERLAEDAPALILVDLHMPRMSGLEFLRSAALLFDTGAARLYLQSAAAPPPDTAEEAARLGATVIDKGRLLDRRWMEALVEDCARSVEDRGR